MLVLRPRAGGATLSIEQPPRLEPGPDDTPAVMRWWNSLAPDERSDWAEAAGSWEPAQAYAAYLRSLERGE